MKAEIERLNAQIVTKGEIDAMQGRAIQYLQEHPEDALEPKGKRGRPKSSTGGASSSQASGAASSSQIQMDTTSTKSYRMQKTNNTL